MILPGETIARIFRGNVTHWDDDAILEHNSHLRHRVKGQQIRLVARSDSSGTTMIFTSALSKIDQTFGKEVGFGSLVKWPTETTLAELSSGVLKAVIDSEFSMGYVPVTYLSRYGPLCHYGGELLFHRTVQDGTRRYPPIFRLATHRYPKLKCLGVWNSDVYPPYAETTKAALNEAIASATQADDAAPASSRRCAPSILLRFLPFFPCQRRSRQASGLLRVSVPVLCFVVSRLRCNELIAGMSCTPSLFFAMDMPGRSVRIPTSLSRRSAERRPPTALPATARLGGVGPTLLSSSSGAMYDPRPVDRVLWICRTLSIFLQWLYSAPTVASFADSQGLYMLPQLMREQMRLQISADLNCWQNGELKAAAAPSAGLDSGSLLETCASLKPAALDVCVNVKLVGSVPSELPRPRFPALSMVNFQAMIVDAFFLAILILMEHVTRVILTGPCRHSL